MARKKKLEKSDGLGPAELKRIRDALRKVWYQSKAHGLVKKRATDKNGFPYCEVCLKKVPKNYVDHIVACGPLTKKSIKVFVTRLFIESNKMQALCKKCHALKTKQDLLKMRNKV